MTSQLRDAWREAGWGFGHSWQLFAGHLPFPFWFARIDYIFYSAHWRAESVELGRWDGTSDHQPVVARLQPIK
jgi:endonuclease/exonuclease/phosphatase (EEP) superfamily protein YafD